jgi:hypothetical protein
MKTTRSVVDLSKALIPTHCNDNHFLEGTRSFFGKASKISIGIVVATALCACASTQAGRGRASAPCPQTDCNRTLGTDERSTAGLGYALYYDPNGNALFGEDLTEAQCRIVNVSINPGAPTPCPATKPWLCGTSPNTFCSKIKYPGCN